MSLYTAARPGALFDLAWDQVDFEARIIYLNPEGRSQTAKHRPTVKLVEPLRAELDAVLIDHVAKVERARQLRRPLPPAAPTYVLEYKNLPIRSIKTAFRAAVAHAGIKGPVVPCTLRHTAATWMAQDGVPLWEIAGYLGHADTRMVEKFYAHHHPDYQKAAAASLARRGAEISVAAPHLRPRKSGWKKGGGSQAIENVGGRDKDRTCDPYDVKAISACAVRKNTRNLPENTVKNGAQMVSFAPQSPSQSRMAAEDGISLNQFAASAVAEKLAALRTAGFFALRRGNGDAAQPGDELLLS